MKRATITMDEYGRVAVPSDAASVWMSEMELVGLRQGLYGERSQV